MTSINPEGMSMIKPCFVVLQGRILPINFGLIAHKHGLQAAECLFPEIPGWALLYLLPSEVGYMAGRGVPSAMDSSLQRSLCGARVMGMYREANVPITLRHPSSPAECDLLLAFSLSVLPPFGSGSRSKRLSTTFSLSHWCTLLPSI